MPENNALRNEEATRKREKMADPTFQANNPQIGDDFAAVYEATAHRITGPVSNTALDLVGIGPGNRILDIAAGAGALSGPAAEMSAAGLGSIEVHRVEGIWRGGVGDAYFADTEALHGYMPPYAALNQADRERLRAAIRTFVAEHVRWGDCRVSHARAHCNWVPHLTFATHEDVAGPPTNRAFAG